VEEKGDFEWMFLAYQFSEKVAHFCVVSKYLSVSKCSIITLLIRLRLCIVFSCTCFS
jgi:hypothetical protein